MSLSARSLQTDHSVVRKIGASGFCFSGAACPGTHKVHRPAARAQPPSAPCKQAPLPDHDFPPSGRIKADTTSFLCNGSNGVAADRDRIKSASKLVGRLTEEELEDTKHSLHLEEVFDDREKASPSRQPLRPMSLLCNSRMLQSCRGDAARGNEVTMEAPVGCAVDEVQVTAETLAKAAAAAKLRTIQSPGGNSSRCSRGANDDTEGFQKVPNDGSDADEATAEPNEVWGVEAESFGEVGVANGACAADSTPAPGPLVVPKAELSFEHLRSEEVEDVCAKVAGSPNLMNLKITGSTSLTDRDWSLIFGPDSDPALFVRWLDMSGNAIADSGAVTISQWFGYARCPELIHVNFRENGIGKRGAMAMAKALGGGNCPLLATVWLQQNQIDDTGAGALADWLGNGHCGCLSLIGLSQNCIGNTGAKALALGLGSGHCPGLKLIGLAGNKVGNEGAELLTQNLKQHCPQFVGLVLEGNPISREILDYSASSWSTVVSRPANPLVTYQSSRMAKTANVLLKEPNGSLQAV